MGVSALTLATRSYYRGSVCEFRVINSLVPKHSQILSRSRGKKISLHSCKIKLGVAWEQGVVPNPCTVFR